MSICTFIASDSPLCEAAPQKEYPLAICVDEGRVYDGGADDNAYLHTLLLGISPIIKQALRACLISRRVWIGEWIFCPARQKSAGILTDGKDF